jgi:hypothetical protein
MRQCLCCLAFCMFLVSGHAEAIEQEQLCWRDLCAGMTEPQVKARLQELGFSKMIRSTTWTGRLLGRLFHGKEGPDEKYAYYFSATGVCGVTDSPCTLSLRFVRFPSGRRRLDRLNTRWKLPAQPLASAVIAEMQGSFGVPDDSSWSKRMPTLNRPAEIVWIVLWRVRGHWRDSVGVEVGLVDKVPLQAWFISPPPSEWVRSVHASSIDFSVHDLSISDAVSEAWSGQKAGWIVDRRTECRLWNSAYLREYAGVPGRSTHITWDGPCVNGYGSGHGVLHWFADGIEYETDEGEFRNGKLNGHAIVTLKGLGIFKRFEGEFRDNRPNGIGTLEDRESILRHESKETYTGTWSRGCFAENGRRAYFLTDRDQCDKF